MSEVTNPEVLGNRVMPGWGTARFVRDMAFTIDGERYEAECELHSHSFNFRVISVKTPPAEESTESTLTEESALWAIQEFIEDQLGA